jgi:tetratricopeptide (TPR) repeat protein
MSKADNETAASPDAPQFGDSLLPVTMDRLNEVWDYASRLTRDLSTAATFTTPGLVDYLNTRLPRGCEPVTKTKIDYLREQGVLRPNAAARGEKRTNWRYGITDVRRALVVELVKAYSGLSVQKTRSWLHSFEEYQRNKRASLTPSPVNSAFALLRNRTLGSLISALSGGKAKKTPRECVIALRGTEDYPPDLSANDSLPTEQVYQRLSEAAWHLAVADAYSKLYLYADIDQMLLSLPEIEKQLADYTWCGSSLAGVNGEFYELIIGSPPEAQDDPAVAEITATLVAASRAGEPLALAKFPGMTTLLRVAFGRQQSVEAGTALAALVELVASASDTWDYCAVLVPSSAEPSYDAYLSVRTHSSRFPSHMRSSTVPMGTFLSGWCYRYRKAVLVQHVVPGDPRIWLYDQEQPTAAAAVPAVAPTAAVAGLPGAAQDPVGVLYVARRRPVGRVDVIFSEEAIAALKAFGHLCGDILARDRVEASTVCRIGASSLSAPRLNPQRFSDLSCLTDAVAGLVRDTVSPVDASKSWLYLLTLNLIVPNRHDSRQGPIIDWLFDQLCEVTADFLQARLVEKSREPLEIGWCEVAPGQFVFAVLRALGLHEKEYKDRLIVLRQNLDSMGLQWPETEVYVWGMAFRYEYLRAIPVDSRAEHVAQVTNRALLASPYITRGHEALRCADLDRAVTEFEAAVRIAPDNWYAHKHLAESRMLQGRLDDAIRGSSQAIKQNPNYASARCLLADCLMFKIDNAETLAEALEHYEIAITLDNTRADFLIRYGIALAGMSTILYGDALGLLRARGSELRRFASNPYEEAIFRFEDALKIAERSARTEQEKLSCRATYYYHCGHAHLKAGLREKALEDFANSRKLCPEDLLIAEAYAYTLHLSRETRPVEAGPDSE